MTSKTLTLHLPAFFERSLDADRAPLSVLRAALVVGEHVVEHRCRYDARHDSLRETALLLRSKIQEMLCFLDAYERKLIHRPSDDELPF
jgi:hypothetical protein